MSYIDAITWGHWWIFQCVLDFNAGLWWLAALTRAEKPGSTFLCLRLVSPSRLDVSMWHTPLGSDVCRSKMSAGMIWLESTLTKSPTRTSFHLLSTKHICLLREDRIQCLFWCMSVCYIHSIPFYPTWVCEFNEKLTIKSKTCHIKINN